MHMDQRVLMTSRGNLKANIKEEIPLINAETGYS